jgi:hypothetical protein
MNPLPMSDRPSKPAPTSSTTGKASEPPAPGVRPEARRHRRFNVDVEVSARTPLGRHLSARTRDVSEAGICLVTNEAVRSGELLTLDVVLSFGEDAYSEPLALAARVVWCTRIGAAFQVGAMFEDVSDQHYEILETFLQFLDGTLAPRGSEVETEDDERPVSPDEKDNPFR